MKWHPMLIYDMKHIKHLVVTIYCCYKSEKLNIISTDVEFFRNIFSQNHKKKFEDTLCCN